MAETGSLELVSLSPASSIRQRLRYSIGDVPTVSLNFRVKLVRDMPARSASACKVHRYAGSWCMAVMAAAICLSARAKSHPTPPFGPSAKCKRSTCTSTIEASCCATRKPPGCRSRSSCLIRSRHQHSAALSASDAALPTLATARAALAVTVEPIKVGGVNAFILTPKEIPAADTNQLMVNLHGGGWIFGAGESGTAEAMQLAAIGGYKVLAIDYRMPPDAPYPAATDDVTAAWRAIVGTMDPRRIAIEGTSAGAGFTVSLMLRAKAEELPLPGAIALCSPPCDLTATGDSFRTNEWIDNVICELRRLSEPRAPTLRGRPQPQGPAVVPNILRLSRLPAGHPHDRHARPTPLRHGASAPQTPEGSVTADLHVLEGLSHAQHLYDPTLTVPKEVFGEIARFFDAHLAK
jgi:epsilon-lactone hydrolase